MTPSRASLRQQLQRARDRLGEVERQIVGARSVLGGVEQRVDAANVDLANSRAAQLIEANEQLLLSALRSQSDVATSVLALDELSESAQLTAKAELHARQVLACMNASLEERVSTRTQELQRARDEAVAGVRAKEQFLSNMSHEIRTPMNGMLGALELLSNSGLDPHQSELIQVAVTSGEALLDVINEVLDFAKISANQLQLAKVPIDVNAIARSAMTVFSAAAQNKGIELRFDADPMLSEAHLGDAMRIRQVLMNLVGNAIKFTPKGAVVVTTRRVATVPSESIEFAVSDTGAGIEKSQQEHVFEPFVQADSPALHHQGSTGLGLAISRDLVRLMGGELALVSAPGEGATFSFTLPLESAASVTATLPPSPAPDLQPLHGRVLLVEDNPVNRLICSAMLESIGIDVVTAEHGEQALEKLAEARFDAVLMDCLMPVMDGFEATRRFRQTELARSGSRTPIIAVTANAFVPDVERCLAAGMDAHLAKPFTIGQLRAALVRWIGQKAAATP